MLGNTFNRCHSPVDRALVCRLCDLIDGYRAGKIGIVNDCGRIGFAGHNREDNIYLASEDDIHYRGIKIRKEDNEYRWLKDTLDKFTEEYRNE